MKYLTISLLIVSLCLSLLMSCGGNASADDTSEASRPNNSINNPSDKLSKEEKIARMNEAHRDKSVVSEEDLSVNAKKNTNPDKIGSDQAEQSSRNMRRKYEEVMNNPPTAKQKLIADNICKCLNNNPLFKTIKNAKTEKEILKLAGNDKDKEVKALQNCYNGQMVPAVSNLGQDAGVFAMKSRTVLNKNCLDGTDKFWINIGAYLSRNAEKSEFEINMPEIEKARTKPQ